MDPVKMEWKTYSRNRLFLLTAGFLMSQLTSVASVTQVVEPTTTKDSEGTTGFQLERYPTDCYVDKSKVSELLVAMNKTVRLINTAEKYLQCQENWQVVQMDPETMEVCSETRIANIQDELDDVAGRLIQLAFRLEEPLKEEVGSLDLRKFRLVDNLKGKNLPFRIS